MLHPSVGGSVVCMCFSKMSQKILPSWQGRNFTFMFFFSDRQHYLSCLQSPYFANTISGAGLEHSCVALWDYLLSPDNKEIHSDSFYPQYLQVRDDSPEHLSSHLQILFLHLYHSKEGYVQLPCQLAPISSYLSPYVRLSSCSASEHGGREIWGKFI